MKNKNGVTPKGTHHKTQSDYSITKETRQEAFVVRPATRAKEILERLGTREMTAREIAYEMGYTDLNAVKPRLTELKSEGKVEVVGKRKDFITERNVAVWRAVI